MAMPSHKFKVGQAVLFRLSTPRLKPVKQQQGRKEEYEIVRLLPRTGSEYQYRIKGGADGHERVVTEIEINPMDIAEEEDAGVVADIVPVTVQQAASEQPS